MTSMNDWNQMIIAEFRANEGKVGGNFENTPLLLLDELAEHHETEVAVHTATTRGVLEAAPMDFLVNILTGTLATDEVESTPTIDLNDVAVEGTPGGKPGGMAQEVTKLDVAFPVNSEIGKEPCHPILHANAPVCNHEKEHRRGCQRLGERGQIEDHFRVHRRSLEIKISEAERTVIDDLALAAHQQYRTRERPPARRLIDRLLHTGPVHGSS